MSGILSNYKTRSLMLACLAALALSACANPKTEALVTTPATGDRYRDALADNYATKARFEEYKMRDFTSAAFYADKGLRAVRGEKIAPEQPEDWGVWAPVVLADLKGARQHLNNVIDLGAPKNFPILTARAMVSYDCWVEQKDEGFQPMDIANCRREFLHNMAMIDGKMADLAETKMQKSTKPMTHAAGQSAMLPQQDFTVFFNFNSAELSSEAMKVLESAAANARLADTRVFEVIGHTDRVGPPAYNEELSEKRAESVENALLDMGFDESHFVVRAKGESDPAISTGDGVREPRNRRVRVVVMDRKITS